MKKWGSFTELLVLFSLVVLAMMGSVAAQDTTTTVGEMPALSDLEAGWNKLVPGGDTICSNDTEFSFSVRPAESNNLLIYLNGGGACWFGVICDLTAEPTTYIPFADISHNVPDEQRGIFDFSNEENPLADYNVVFI